MPLSPVESVALIDTWAGSISSEHAREILPYDTRSFAESFLANNSGCALVGKAHFRHVGCTCREHGPYEPRIGQAVADIQRIAQRHGAWISNRIDLSQSANDGDVFGIDVHPKEHIVVVRTTRAFDSAVLSVDGGQGTHGAYIEQRARHHIAPIENVQPFLVDIADGISTRVGVQRIIYARVDIATLASTLHLCK